MPPTAVKPLEVRIVATQKVAAPWTLRASKMTIKVSVTVTLDVAAILRWAAVTFWFLT